MIPVKIKGATVSLGKPRDWDPRNGECGVLFARQESVGEAPVLLSAWKPTASELEILTSGGSVILGVVGQNHPPVLMYASEED